MKMPENKLVSHVRATIRRAVVVTLGFSFMVNLLMLAAPLYMLQVYDRVLTSRSEETLLLLTLIAVAALVTMAALEVVRHHVMIKVGAWLDRRLGGQMLEGAIISTLRAGANPNIQPLRDLAALRNFFSSSTFFPFVDAPWTPVFLVIIFLLHPLLGWISLFGGLVLFSLAVVNELMTRRILGASSQATMMALNHAEAAVRNADVIEAMGILPNLLRRWHGYNSDGVEGASRASARSALITAISRFIRMGLQVAILGAGAWLVLEGEATAGVMIAASILMGRALAPVEQSISAWRSAVAARESYARILAQLRMVPDGDRGMALPRPKGEVRVEQLTYLHPNQTEPVLRGVSFALAPGEVLGVIGPSGCGKSTLVKLLLGNIVPRVGHVRLDGVEVSQWHSSDMGQHVGYLPQDIELFAGTIKDNIARMADADADKVIRATKLAGCHNMILSLPMGYETPIGPGGAMLSGGERQRIGLARALYGRPKLVVLDEPNSNLDNEGERALLVAIKALKKMKVTVVVVAHGPRLLRNADKVLMLRNGMVEAFGPKDKVLAEMNARAAASRKVTKLHG